MPIGAENHMVTTLVLYAVPQGHQAVRCAPLTVLLIDPAAAEFWKLIGCCIVYSRCADAVVIEAASH